MKGTFKNILFWGRKAHTVKRSTDKITRGNVHYRWECPEKGIMGENEENVTLQKRPITIIILCFWRSHTVC